MSSVERAARSLKSLKDEEWRTLAGLERASAGKGTSDVRRLSRAGKLPVERVEFAVDELLRKGLVQKRGAGFGLSREGVEALALKDYVRRDLISAIGAAIAKGKESDVFEALTEEGTTYALKFFKIGRTSFTRVRKSRPAEGAEFRNWLTANYEAAKREYTALRRLEGLSECFPRAVAFSRSSVLLQELSGVRLSQRPPLEDPSALLLAVLGAVRVAYAEAGLVNGDLSEYNILTDGRSAWLIDWPQAVEATHPNAPRLLDHDVRTVVSFFRRAHGTDLTEEAALSYVRGGNGP
jgi:RIO kinase 2